MTPETFKEIRLALGYSQARLAIILGVSHGTISNWEQGYRPIPDEHRKEMEEMYYD